MSAINNQNFSYLVLQDENRFNDFFSGKSQIEEIKNNCLNENLPILETFSTISTSRKIVDLLKLSFELIGMIFFTIASKVLIFSSLSTRCSLIANHLRYNIIWHNNIFIYENQLMCSSRNIADFHASDLYLKRPFKWSDVNTKISNKTNRAEVSKIFVKCLQDVKNELGEFFDNIPRKFLDFTKHTQIDFSKTSGICYGMSTWFLYLFLKTKETSLNRDRQLKVIGKTFENGANQQSLLLSHMQNNLVFKKNVDPEILDYPKSDPKADMDSYLLFMLSQIDRELDRVETKFSTHDGIVIKNLLVSEFPIRPTTSTLAKYFKIPNQPNLKIDLDQLWFKIILDYFWNSLSDGAYLIYLRGKDSHAVSFIKDGTKKYLFDPNIGTLKFDEPKDFAIYFRNVIKDYEGIRFYKSSLISDPSKISLISAYLSKVKNYFFTRV